MAWLKYGLLWSSVGVFLLQTWGYFFLFRRPEGTPVPMRAVAVVSVALTAVIIAEISDNRPGLARGLPALALIALSAALYLWSVAATRATALSIAFSRDAPERLFAHGPYRHVRHPFYTSYLLFWAGGTLATDEWWLWLGVVAMAATFTLIARREEAKFAASPLAGDYQRYRARTGMFLPVPRWRG